MCVLDAGAADGIVADVMIRAAAPLAAFLCAAAASAEPAPVTRLGRCGGETCLLVAGHRADAAAPVRIAGRAVAVRGGRRWRAAVPLRMVRAWSAPAARSIPVAVADEDEIAVPLPIGLLGQVTELASLDVGAAR